MSRRSSRWPALVAALAVVVLVIGGCAWLEDDDEGAATTTTATTSTTVASLQSVPRVVADVAPSVVVVRSGPGEGSGVVWSADGRIVTNDHVVADPDDVTVLLADGTEERAEVVATDPFTDLALLRIDRTGLPQVDRAEVLPPVGTGVVAIGNPLGFENSVSVGVISGERRSVPGAAARAPALVDLLQTDAAISPGNSGGALVDLSGDLVGVTVAYLPPQGTGAVSIGFAIPVSTVVDVVEELATTGRAVHAFAGVQLAPVTPRLAEAYGLPERGAVVLEVVPDSPAAAAGLEGGDVVVGVDGSEVAGPETVLTAIRRSEPGDRLELRVRAPGGEERTVVLELAERLPPEPAP